METSNKKRPVIKRDRTTSGKKKRSNGGVTTEDGELEEFLAILQRLQAGLKYYQKRVAGDCVGNTVVPPPERVYGLVTPAFKAEDFMEINDGRRRKSAGDLVQNDGVFGFDLNSDPGSGEKSD